MWSAIYSAYSRAKQHIGPNVTSSYAVVVTFFLQLTIMYPTQHKYSLALISTILAGWGSKFYK